jgi:hypothetical protein
MGRPERCDRLAAGFRVRGEAVIPAGTYIRREGRFAAPSPACVQVRRPGQERLELSPDEAEALANALLAEAAFARGEP